MDWVEIRDKYGLDCNPDTIRKGSTTIFGGYARREWDKLNNGYSSTTDDLDTKLKEIRKERMKLQTANLERTRIERNEARQELYYEYIGMACQTLPLPNFQPLNLSTDNEIKYCLNIADIHYGASFVSTNNAYSPEIAQERFEYLAGYVENFVKSHNVNTLTVLGLGDSIQGILRLSDLKINDSSVVKAIVSVSRLIGSFLNEISKFVKVEYYHVPSANHSQTRPLGSKASELADEDMEYVIGNYISDLLVCNDRVKVHLGEEGDQYLELDIAGFDIIVGHGHNIKGTKNSLKNLSVLRGKFYDYAIFGHFHGGDMFTANEGIDNDCEVIVCPSFIGSDPYSDKLMCGAKAACQILGFDKTFGHTETYKVILN